MTFLSSVHRVFQRHSFVLQVHIVLIFSCCSSNSSTNRSSWLLLLISMNLNKVEHIFACAIFGKHGVHELNCRESMLNSGGTRRSFSFWAAIDVRRIVKLKMETPNEDGCGWNPIGLIAVRKRIESSSQQSHWCSKMLRACTLSLTGQYCSEISKTSSENRQHTKWF